MKVVLYHSNCNDGLFAAYACWLKFGNDAVYIPVGYKPIQDLEPIEALKYIFNIRDSQKEDIKSNTKHDLSLLTVENSKDINLYMVDYSVPVEHFKIYSEMFKSITVLDHHDSAIKAYCSIYPYVNKYGRKTITLGEQINIVFADKESGAKLTYSYLFPEKEMPSWFELVSDRDLWEFKLKNTKIFHAGIKALSITNFKKLDSILNYGISKILDIGTITLENEEKKLNKVKSTGYNDVTIVINNQEYKGCFINSYLDIASDLCSKIIQEDNYDIVIAYHIAKDFNVSCSVRSKKEIDSSGISVVNKGGGHANASGFSIPFLKLSNILNEKVLIVKGVTNVSNNS